MFQTVEAPNGMCIHMYGPRSYRTNDLDLFHDSQISQLVAQAQAGPDLQYSIYGDGIYVHDTHTIRRHIDQNAHCQRVGLYVHFVVVPFRQVQGAVHCCDPSTQRSFMSL